MKSTKLTVKDIITIVLLSLVNTIIFGFSTLFYLAPIAIVLTPVFFSLLQGIVFFMLGAKIRKKGAILLYCIIMGVVGFNIPYILMHVIAGILAEIILAKKGYGDPKAMTVSYILLQLLAAFGSTIYPYAIILNATLSGIEGNGDLGVNIAAAGEMLQSWFLIVLLAAIVVSAWLGALLGKKMVEKHLGRKKEVEE